MADFAAWSTRPPRRTEETAVAARLPPQPPAPHDIIALKDTIENSIKVMQILGMRNKHKGPLYFQHRPDESLDDGLGAVSFTRCGVAYWLLSVSTCRLHRKMSTLIDTLIDRADSLAAHRVVRHFFRGCGRGRANGRPLPGSVFRPKSAGNGLLELPLRGFTEPSV
jgi:hypothetical protein